MTERIPYSCQTIEDDDIEAVVNVLRGDFLTQGPAIHAFENAYTQKTDAPYAVAVSSCTAGLHITVQALGLTKGKILWTSPNSFVTSANVGLYCGAEVDFVDINPETGSLCPDALEKKLGKAKKVNALPHLLIAVHFAGHTHQFNIIADLCEAYGVLLVEDGAHTCGAFYADDPQRYVSIHPKAVAGVASFHPVKSITSGEGGMVAVRDEALYQQLLRLRSHGITKDPALLSYDNAPIPPWYYEEIELGYHYRMTDFQAALGTSQLAKLDRLMDARRNRAKQYHQALSTLPVDLPPQSDTSSWHLYVVRMHDAEKRNAVILSLREKHIEAHLHYIPIYRQPVYQPFGYEVNNFSGMEAYYASAITLPLFPNMTDEQQERVIEQLTHTIHHV